MEKVRSEHRRWCSPTPAFLVGANVEGKANFMTVAWGGIACMSLHDSGGNTAYAIYNEGNAGKIRPSPSTYRR
jgi:hypothetical protein